MKEYEIKLTESEISVLVQLLKNVTVNASEPNAAQVVAVVSSALTKLKIS